MSTIINLRNPDSAGVKRTNSDGTVNWIVVIPVEPDYKGFNIDKQENLLYIATWTSPVNVLMLNASTGSLSSQVQL